MSRRFPEFRHIALHAPSRFSQHEEEAIAKQLSKLRSNGWPIIVHPDSLRTPRFWRPFGRQLCIENMDQRKRSGRTCEEMVEIFRKFPEASFCFDIGHAQQVDPPMSHAV